MDGKITEDFWTRKSDQWEGERRTLEAELLRLDHPNGEMTLTGHKILRTAKQAGFPYKSRIRSNSFDCSKRCFRTAPSTVELFVPPTLSPSTPSRRALKLEIGGEGGIRTHVPLTGQDAFEAPPLRPLRYLSV